MKHLEGIRHAEFYGRIKDQDGWRGTYESASGGGRTSDGPSGLDLVVRRPAVVASEAHHDDFSKVGNGGEHHASDSLRSSSAGGRCLHEASGSPVPRIAYRAIRFLPEVCPLGRRHRLWWAPLRDRPPFSRAVLWKGRTDLGTWKRTDWICHPLVKFGYSSKIFSARMTRDVIYAAETSQIYIA